MSDYYFSLPLLALAAPLIGSFLTVLIVRLPSNEPILLARSRCRNCKKKLAVRDLFPIISWVLLAGKCRYCGSPMSRLYPAMEIGAIIVVLWAGCLANGTALFVSAILGWLLLTLAVIDWRTHLLPDTLTLSLLIAGIVATATLNPAALYGHITGALLGFASFWLIGFAYRHIRRTDGLGLGDAKLLAGIGAWVSWEGLASVVLIACFTAFTYLAMRQIMWRDVRRDDRLPFGPFLSLAGWLVWLYGTIQT